MAITSEKMRADLRLMNQDMAKMGANLRGEEKVRFLENSGCVLQNFAVLADFQRMKEQGVTHVTPEQVRALAGASADRLIERARNTAKVEQREAQEARYAAEALAASPAKTIDPNPMENSTRVDRLREEQRRVMEEFKRQAEAEAASQKPKGQGQ